MNKQVFLIFIMGILSAAFVSISASAESSKLLDETASHMVEGSVADMIHVGNYTYVQVKTSESEKVWAAAPTFKASIGDSVTIPKGAPMSNFHSKSLGKTFELIYFVSHIENESSPASTERGKHIRDYSSSKKNNIDLNDVNKADGGITVAELFDGSKELNEKNIKLRGKVVKYTARIMGKNWIHLQDGTSAKDGRNDLTLTTLATAKVGEIVLVEGKVTLDKDYGAGYHYDVIIENADIFRE